MYIHVTNLCHHRDYLHLSEVSMGKWDKQYKSHSYLELCTCTYVVKKVVVRLYTYLIPMAHPSKDRQQLRRKYTWDVL